MCLFCRCLAQTQPQYAAKLITSLCPVSSSIYQPQRVMVSAIIAEVSSYFTSPCHPLKVITLVSSNCYSLPQGFDKLAPLSLVFFPMISQRVVFGPSSPSTQEEVAQTSSRSLGEKGPRRNVQYYYCSNHCQR